MNTYKVLNNQFFEGGEYILVPIRYQDRYDIKKWRNEQIYHLRQSEPLTKEKQDWYFSHVIAELFEEERPGQLLFSFLKEGRCIGYGGLVHINWLDQNAEVSFLMNTELEEECFEILWGAYLELIKKVAFEDLNLLKIYTVAFDLRPKLYDVLDRSGFKCEGAMLAHAIFNDKPIKVYQHGFINNVLTLKDASRRDAEITYSWATDQVVRKYAITKEKIKWEDHLQWFYAKLENDSTHYFIANWRGKKIGSFRIDLIDNSTGIISYLLDPNYHGLGLGKCLLLEGIRKSSQIKGLMKLEAKVDEGNVASKKLFSANDFLLTEKKGDLLTYTLDLV